MPESFTMTVSADERFRVLAPEVAGKYAGLLGGSEADGESLAAALTEAIASLVGDAEEADVIDLTFRPNGNGVAVEVTCGDRSTVVTHTLLAPKD